MSSHHIVQFIRGSVPSQPGSPKRRSATAALLDHETVVREFVSGHDRVQVERTNRDHMSRGYKQLKMLADFTCTAMEEIPKHLEYSRGGHIGGTTSVYSENLRRIRRQYEDMDGSSSQQIAHMCFVVWKCYVQGSRLHTVASNSAIRREVLDYRGMCVSVLGRGRGVQSVRRAARDGQNDATATLTPPRSFLLSPLTPQPPSPALSKKTSSKHVLVNIYVSYCMRGFICPR